MGEYFENLVIDLLNSIEDGGEDVILANADKIKSFI